MWSSQGSLINALRIDHLFVISLIWFSRRLPNRHMSFACIRELLSEQSRSNQCMEDPSLRISRFMPCVQHHACVWACLSVCVCERRNGAGGCECKSVNAASFSQICITNCVPIELSFAAQVSSPSSTCWALLVCFHLTLWFPLESVLFSY